MTREEIKNTPKVVDRLLDKCVLVDSRAKLRKRLEEVCDMAIKASEQQSTLDKIRAEIKQLTSRYTVSRERGGMGQVEWSDRFIKEDDVLNIIDKYRTEGEE